MTVPAFADDADGAAAPAAGLNAGQSNHAEKCKGSNRLKAYSCLFAAGA